jgi:hypothetical protein
VVMRRVPQDVHREVLERADREFGGEPVLYAVWLGPPHGEKSVLLGRTQRTSRPRWWRAFPVTGEYPEFKRGWINVVEWMLEVRAVHALVPPGETSGS